MSCESLVLGSSPFTNYCALATPPCAFNNKVVDSRALISNGDHRRMTFEEESRGKARVCATALLPGSVAEVVIEKIQFPTHINLKAKNKAARLLFPSEAAQNQHESNNIFDRCPLSRIKRLQCGRSTRPIPLCTRRRNRADAQHQRRIPTQIGFGLPYSYPSVYGRPQFHRHRYDTSHRQRYFLYSAAVNRYPDQEPGRIEPPRPARFSVA
ncbi:hypothetical protein DFJ77DRAFT_450580 [Powellomyces hirtus]|nr:hypothetical protein DFJ77DRAFT_450580 [Powellomyces hirtus]